MTGFVYSRNPLKAVKPRALLLWGASLLWLSCGGDDLNAPGTGEIEVTVSTSGPEPDADGYTLSLDGHEGMPIDARAGRTLTVPEGDHLLELGGLAANCAVSGGPRQSVRVAAGEVAPAVFEIVCGETTGGLRVVTTTTGPEPDPDGYALTVDEQDPQPIGPSAEVTVTGLAQGEHTVALTGVAENCSIAEDNPRTVPVTAGEILDVPVTVTCVAVEGGIAVTTSTSGPAPDPDGYTIRVDQGPEQPVGADATATIGDLAPGTHTVELGGLAPNCQVDGENPRTVELAAGGAVAVAFRVVCSAGVQQWTPMVSGTTADLPEVWGTSPTDVFVVGEAFAAGELTGVMLHFDGTAWTRQHREPNLRPRGVWGSSPADVFAVGFDFFSSDAKVWHYDGTAWSEVPGFTSPVEDLAFLSVWGASPTEVFAVGGAFDGQFDHSLIYRYDGSRWERMPVAGSVAPTLTDVWGSSATDVYAVGRDDEAFVSTGVVLHYDGSAWRPVLEQEGLVPNSVWASSDSDVFVAGFEVDEDFRVTGTMWHYDGSRWSRVDLPPLDEILYEVWGTGPADVFAVGESGTVLHFDGTAWTATRPTSRSLLGVWGSSPSDVYAVGNRGTILHGTP
jgi:hypothetical protein